MKSPYDLGKCVHEDFPGIHRQLFQRWQISTVRKSIDDDISAIFTTEVVTVEYIVKASAFIIGWNAHRQEGK